VLSLLKFLLIIALTVFLLVRKWDLGLVLLLNTALVAVLFAYPALLLLRSIGLALIASDTLSLAGAVYLVLVLAELMRRTHSMEGMASALQALVPDSRVVLALIPLLIGLMPMLGGAMFSAPMVNEIGAALQLRAERKTYINYWFRHTMEYVFPLYSSVLMLSALFGFSVYDFVRTSWPMTLVAIGAGILIGLVGIPKPAAQPSQARPSGAWGALFRSTWPLLAVVLAVAVLKLNMLVTLLGVIVGVVLINRIGPSQWLDVLKRSFPIHTFTAIFGVMIFKHVLEDAGAVAQVPPALAGLGLPPLLIAFLVPLLVGLLTGVAPAALVVSVPLVAPLLTGLGLDPLTAGLWIFVGGFSGVLLSPMHLCLALTRDYFKANWAGLYRAILPSVAIAVAAAVVLVLLRQR